MIYTGSTKTLINTTTAYEHYPENVQEDQFQIQSAHNISCHNHSITIPLSKIFNRPDLQQKFYVFDFNPKYDGLIGIDLLKTVGAAIDLDKKKLVTKNTEIPLYFDGEETINKQNSKIPIFHVELLPRTEHIIEVPVDKSLTRHSAPYKIWQC